MARHPQRHWLRQYLSNQQFTIRQRRIPVVQQMEISDCGAACLAMILQYHGKFVRLHEVRRVAGAGRDGVDALRLLHAGAWFGLIGHGITVDVDALPDLPPATIIHWKFSHFVVFERVDQRGVLLTDPSIGRRRVTMEEFRRSFTGVALVFEPGLDFQTGTPRRVALWRHLRRIRSYPGLMAQVLLTTGMVQMLTMALPLLIATLVDYVIPQADLGLLQLLGIGLLITAFFYSVSSLIRAHLLLHLRAFLDKEMTLDFMRHLVRLPFSFFQERSAGDLMMRVNSNTVIREVLTSGSVSTLLDGCLVVLR